MFFQKKEETRKEVPGGSDFFYGKKRKWGMSTKKIIVLSVFGVFVVGLLVLAGYVLTTDKKTIAVQSLGIVNSVAKLLPIEADTKKAINAADQLAQALTQKDGVTRTYMIMLQNNYELRPGGGFLGQYAIVKIKDGAVVKFSLEDANILDQRIVAKVPTPYPFRQKLQLKNWKFRDSNFSPDFPTNVAKAQYFYRLAGGWEKFDGVIAVNADVFNEALKVTGPVTVPGYNKTFTGDDGALVLEEAVERAYLGDDVPAESKQHRKDIMKSLGGVMVEKLVTVENIPKLAEFSRTQLENKNIMLHLTDEKLQAIVSDVHWDGSVTPDWSGDYLFAVDANMGSLKTDYYVRRKIDYVVDLTSEKPTATLTYIYKNTAPYGDWRTSDYHTYLRVYVPQGSVLLDRKMVGPPRTGEEFGKTYFGAMVDVRMGEEVRGIITYQLPDRFKTDPYKFLIQKQSGVQDVPVDITIKTSDGDIHQTGTLKKDLVYQVGK